MLGDESLQPAARERLAQPAHAAPHRRDVRDERVLGVEQEVAEVGVERGSAEHEPLDERAGGSQAVLDRRDDVGAARAQALDEEARRQVVPFADRGAHDEHARSGRAVGGGHRAGLIPGPAHASGGAGKLPAAMADEQLAPMKAQVYKDPRPAEYFDRFHVRVAHARAGLGLRARARGHGPLRADLLPHALHRLGQRAGARQGDPRAEPLLVHGPLLHRRLHAPARALHGEVAAVHEADAVDLLARRRLPGAARRTTTRTRSSRRTRSSIARARSSCTARAAARAAARWATSARPGIGRLALAVGRAGRADRDLRLPARAQLEEAAVPEGARPVRRAARPSRSSGARRASSSRRAPTRSSARSGRSTPTSSSTARSRSRRRVRARAAAPAPAARRRAES